MFLDHVAADCEETFDCDQIVDETFDEKLDLRALARAILQGETQEEWSVPGENRPSYEELRDLLLYMGGPVNYDRYVDPAAYHRLAEIGLVAENRNGAVEFTALGKNVVAWLRRLAK